jgi:hypothetical protein
MHKKYFLLLIFSACTASAAFSQIDSIAFSQINVISALDFDPNEKPKIYYHPWQGGRQLIEIDSRSRWNREVMHKEQTHPRALPWSMVIPRPDNALIFRDTTGKIIAQYHGSSTYKARDIIAQYHRSSTYKASDFAPVGKEKISKAIPIEPHLRDYVIIHKGKPVYLVRKNNLAGLIDQRGEIVFDFVYANISQGENVYYFSTAEGKTGVMDSNFKLILPAQYEYLHQLKENPDLYIIVSSNYYGLINKRGEVVKEAIYYGGIEFHNGFALVMRHENLPNGQHRWRRGFLDTNGNEVIPCIYDDVRHFREDMAAVQIDGKWGFINKAAKIVVEPQYDYVGTFINGLASVRMGGYNEPPMYFGFVDKDGNEIIPPTTYRYMGATFNEGLTPVCLDRACGYINKKNEVVIPLIYSNVGDFQRGRAKVSQADKTFYINTKGETVK